MEMGDKIRTRRLGLGLTLEDVGNAVGVGKSTVRKWESGDIKNMRRDKIASLASILQTTPAYLMGWDDAESALSKVGMGIDDIAYEMNIPVEIVKEIIAGNDLNDPVALRKVVRVAELLFKEKAPTPVSESERSTEFVELMSQLTPDEQKLIVSQIKGILSNQE